jgi:predicted dehydrogenase
MVLVGTGNIAGTYVAAADKLDCAKIVGVVSRSGERAKTFADEHGIAHSAPALKDVSCDFDAVILATPNGEHHRGAIEAAGLRKHVLSEKPLDITAGNMDRMIRACKDAGVKLGTVYLRRTRENNKIIKSLLEKNTLGRVYAVDLSLKVYRPQEYYDSAAWRGTRALDGGGPFMQQGSHDIDLVCWLFGKPVSVLGMVGTFGHTGIEVEDHGVGILETRDGALISIVASTIAKPGFPPRMDVFTERGTFSLENDCITFWEVEGMDNPGVAPEVELHSSTSAAVTDTSGHEAIMRDFVEAVRTDRDPLVPGEQGRIATDVILAIYRSSEEGVKVSLEP